MWIPAVSRHRFRVPAYRLAGASAIAIATDRFFPRHAHDQFGVGVMLSSGNVSWSGVGRVEAGRGDAIAVSISEMHDGGALGGVRRWEMVFVEPAVVAQVVHTDASAREIGFAARKAVALASSVRAARRALAEGDAPAAERALTALLGDLRAPATTVKGDRAFASDAARARTHP